MKHVLVLMATYLLGSIPWAYLLAKWTRGIDIRQYGSGNVGFTNALRIIGKGPAAVVLFGDVGKGIAAVMIAKYEGGAVLAILAGLMVVIGHNYPVFLHFKGGKGAAAGFGALLALVPEAAILAIGLWGVVLAITRYVSLATILAAISVPVCLVVLGEDTAYIIFGIVGALFVIFKHHANITRLLNGTEHKIGKKCI